MISIRRALFLVCLLLVSAPLVLFWVWPNARALEDEIQAARQHHLLLARTAARALERYHDELIENFDQVASTLDDSRSSPDGRLLRSVHIRHLGLIHAASGAAVAVVEGTRSAAALRLDQPTLAALRSIALTGAATLSGIMADGDGRPVFYLVRALTDKLAVAVVDPTYATDFARSIRFGDMGHMVVVDMAGRAVAHPDQEWERERRDLSALSLVRRVLAGESGVEEFFSPAYRADMIAGYSPVRGASWGVLVPQPVLELRKEARSTRQRLFTIFATGLILASLIAIRAGIILTAPLNRLTAGARSMADGRLDVRVDCDSRTTPQELVELTASFNNMAERLAELSARSAELRERAEKASNSKTEFLRTVTHELRSPLNAIIGFSELLTGRSAAKISPDMRDGYLRDIAASSRHMLSLVNDLLDLAKMESGQYQLSESDFWLDEIVQRAARYVEPQARERDIELQILFDGEPPLLRGDERALFQALLNLVSNAVRYGRRGGKVTVASSLRPGGSLLVEVADDGPGIAPDDIQRVLLPFQRARSTTNPGAVGTGLGLPIVKRFVELHDGKFELASKLGEGTRALIELPVSRVRSHSVVDEDVAETSATVVAHAA